MTEFLMNKVYKFADILMSDPRVINLNKKNLMIEKNDEILAISKTFKHDVENYNHCLNLFGETNELTISALKTMTKSKTILDTHSLVHDYNEAFIPVRDLYLHIENILFSTIKENAFCKECHD